MKGFSSIDKKIGIILGLVTFVLLFSLSNTYAETYEDPLRRKINLLEPRKVPDMDSIPTQKRDSINIHIDGIKNILFGRKYPPTDTPFKSSKLNFSIQIEVVEGKPLRLDSKLVIIIKDSGKLTRGFKTITLANVVNDINKYKNKDLDVGLFGAGDNLIIQYTFQLPKNSKLGKWEMYPILYSEEEYTPLDFNSPLAQIFPKFERPQNLDRQSIVQMICMFR